MPTTKSFIIFGTMKYSMLIRFEHTHTHTLCRLDCTNWYQSVIFLQVDFNLIFYSVMSSETVFHISFWFSFYLAIIINWGGDEILMIAFMGKWQIIEWNDAVIWTRIGDLINPNESVTITLISLRFIWRFRTMKRWRHFE